MKTIKKGKSEIFKGAGILTGLAIGFAVSVVIFLFTDLIALVGPLAGGLGIPLGVILEKKFQGEVASARNPIMEKVLLFFFALGVVLLAVVYFYAKFI